jgi:hypothetical protein
MGARNGNVRGTRGGRKTVTGKKRTYAGEMFARAIVEDEEVVQRLLTDCRAGMVAPAVLIHLLSMAYGRPIGVQVEAEPPAQTITIHF